VVKSRDSSVGIALGYGLDDRGQGIFLFTTASRTALGPTQPPIQWVPGTPLGVELSGHETDHSPTSSAKVKEWVELYLHIPSTPSWCGAQLKISTGTTLPLFLYLYLYLYLLPFTFSGWGDETCWPAHTVSPLCICFVLLVKRSCNPHLRTAWATYVAVALRSPNGASGEQICQSVLASAAEIITVAWGRVLEGGGGTKWAFFYFFES
jgi:hypothetical protein